MAVKREYTPEEIEILNREADKRLEEMRKVTGALDHVVSDTDLMNAVIAFRLVLQAAKDILGDKLENETAVEAIKAGSYIAWRGIMGQAQPPQRRF